MNDYEGTVALAAAFQYFYNKDKANAAIHLSVPRFSPITFQLAEALKPEHRIQDMLQFDSSTPYQAEEVRQQMGKYPQDRGRIDIR